MSREEHTLKTLPVGLLKEHSEFPQVRDKMIQLKINLLAERMRFGIPIPAIEVAQIGQNYYVIDGWHRLEAAVRAKIADIPCDVYYKITIEEAKARSVDANTSHGTNLGGRDCKPAFIRYMEGNRHILEDGSAGPRAYKSYRHIAAELGCGGKSSIERWMKELFSSVAEDISEQNSTTPDKKKGKPTYTPDGSTNEAVAYGEVGTLYGLQGFEGQMELLRDYYRNLSPVERSEAVRIMSTALKWMEGEVGNAPDF
uniref:ParB domain protein nuclease n=1 Tax=Nitratidesulfovibrio vulgaris (strain DSM 19637 / Miyazaki F) TaxID=883 RepID=B8DJ04_NITV9